MRCLLKLCFYLSNTSCSWKPHTKHQVKATGTLRYFAWEFPVICSGIRPCLSFSVAAAAEAFLDVSVCFLLLPLSFLLDFYFMLSEMCNSFSCKVLLMKANGVEGHSTVLWPGLCLSMSLCPPAVTVTCASQLWFLAIPVSQLQGDRKMKRSWSGALCSPHPGWMVSVEIFLLEIKLCWKQDVLGMFQSSHLFSSFC